MVNANGSGLLTAAEVAAEVGLPPSRARHFLDSRGVRPAARAGLVRLYRPDAIERVREAAREVEERRRSRKVAVGR